MDPKAAANAQLMLQLERQLGHANVVCLATYAKLLRSCGVRQINVFAVPAEKM